MAVRRCFSSKITESDPFYKLPVNAQALYLHLNMQADDDGFINNASGIASRFKGGVEALGKLVESRFLLKFEDVYVIKHWRISNTLKNDRLKPLSYASISARIWVKGNRAYTDHPVSGCVTLYETRTGVNPPVEWIPNGFQPDSKRIPNGFQPDSTRIPNGFLTEPNLTEPNRTEPNRRNLAGLFEQIEKEYPGARVGNREDAYSAFCQAAQGDGAAETMLDNLRLWKQSEQWDKEDGKYIPYLANWILRGTWKTKPDRMAVPKGASGQLGQAEIEAIKRVLGQPIDELPPEREQPERRDGLT